MAAKSQPFSLRLSSRMDALITEEARRTRRSKGAVVEALAEEALRNRLFPGIAFRGTDWERRPWVIGTALDVWEIILAYDDFGSSIERMVRETDLTERQIRLAVAYYEHFPDEIDAAIAETRQPPEAFRVLFPTIDIHAVST
jgi:uncharacterized protein (DUF433 family)